MDTKKFLLFLPEWDLHELGLLVYDYLIKSRGYKVIYLGQNVPEDDVYAVSDFLHPDYFLAAFANAVEKEKIETYIQRISSPLSRKKYSYTGHQTTGFTCTFPSNVTIINSALQFSNEYSLNTLA